MSEQNENTRREPALFCNITRLPGVPPHGTKPLPACRDPCLRVAFGDWPIRQGGPAVARAILASLWGEPFEEENDSSVVVSDEYQKWRLIVA